MLSAYMAQSGLSFNAVAYHRVMQCFRYHGNVIHTPDSQEITLLEFQTSIKSRHEAGSRGTEVGGIFGSADLGVSLVGA